MVNYIIMSLFCDYKHFNKEIKKSLPLDSSTFPVFSIMAEPESSFEINDDFDEIKYLLLKIFAIN